VGQGAKSLDDDDEPQMDSQSEEDGENKAKSNGAASSASTTKSFKHLADGQWTQFVENKLNKFETKWTKKLETYTAEDHLANEVDPEEVEVQINTSDSDDDIVLKDHHDLAKSMQDGKLSNMFDSDIKGMKEGKHKDDWAVGQQDKEYLANQYWKVPEQFDLDDLLKDAEL
jgi:hypothetical protein